MEFADWIEVNFPGDYERREIWDLKIVVTLPILLKDRLHQQHHAWFTPCPTLEPVV